LLTTPDVKKYFFKGLDSGGLEMHQNSFSTTPEVNKTMFLGLDSGGLEVCANA
jgi:hypothetical protein